MTIQGSGHCGVNKFKRINFFDSVLNFTLVVACCKPGGSISHILIPLRLSIKIILFPVDRPGGSKRCGWKLFFSFFQKLTIFSWKKKKSGNKKNCGRPTGFNFSHPLDRKQNFFYGQPHHWTLFLDLLNSSCGPVIYF